MGANLRRRAAAGRRGTRAAQEGEWGVVHRAWEELAEAGNEGGAGSSIRGMNGMRRARLLQAMREVDGVARVERLRERGQPVRPRDGGGGADHPPGAGRVGGAARCGSASGDRGAARCSDDVRDAGAAPRDLGARRETAPSPGRQPGQQGREATGGARALGSALVPRHPDALEDPIENVLSLVSTCEPYEQALATWESALNKGLVDRERLLRLRWGPGGRRLLAEALPFADAGLETYLRVRLRWLRLPLRFQTWIAGHRVDALIGERLVLQIDGGTHVGAQRDQDNAHDAELKLRGFHVIRLGYHQVMDEWPGAGPHHARRRPGTASCPHGVMSQIPPLVAGLAPVPATSKRIRGEEHAYNGHTSIDPAITGELSEERSGDGLSRTERGRPVTAAVRVVRGSLSLSRGRRGTRGGTAVREDRPRSSIRHDDHCERP